MGGTFLDKFWSRVDVRGPDECWLWTGGRKRTGYGVVWPRGSSEVGAHRLSWELHNAQPIPDGMFACHSCDVPSCVNPSHIWIGTHDDNMRDALVKGRMHYAEKLINLTGQRFGKWTVLGRDPAPVLSGTRWLVRCDCGHEASINGQALRLGRTAQCDGCRCPWRVGQKLGMRTLIERIKSGWVAQCDECGALVTCQPSTLETMSCRRCGLREHKRGRMFTINGETHNLAGWARKLGISREAIRVRIERGMSPEAACTTPRIGCGGIRIRGAA